ncbi:hypothetical protein HHL22_16765 [Hymenobacter sp. RP-2-7]|uniref:DUF4468 domain-containing protein n=1 Tax=Hymenobacter polaris TaxID=2682546 RepID=A0A7Y0AGE2_9BACT|nr:hypothetical protein [Hymenobacter polaris]NML66859.1 hypothetical protein [Hymenobacter polaris]
MKAVFAFLLLLATGPAGAQQLMAPVPVDATTRLVTYTAVVPAPGVAQASLLARARVWAARVGIPDKPPVMVSELGTDVLVVAGMQAINSAYDISPQSLYFLARVALREGRYQYRLEELTLVTTSSTEPPIYRPAEALFLSEAPPKATGSSYATRQRKAFEEAVGQAAATLQFSLTTPLTAGTGADW